MKRTMEIPMKLSALLLLVLAVLPVDLYAQEVGPARGSLVVVGGAMQDPASPSASSTWPAARKPSSS